MAEQTAPMVIEPEVSRAAIGGEIGYPDRDAEVACVAAVVLGSWP